MPNSQSTDIYNTVRKNSIFARRDGKILIWVKHTQVNKKKMKQSIAKYRSSKDINILCYNYKYRYQINRSTQIRNMQRLHNIKNDYGLKIKKKHFIQ